MMTYRQERAAKHLVRALKPFVEIYRKLSTEYRFKRGDLASEIVLIPVRISDLKDAAEALEESFYVSDP